MTRTTKSQLVVIITGASSGIGKACAEFLADHGMRVYGTSRNAPSQPLQPSRTMPASVMLRMDVDDDNSVRHAIDWICRNETRIDVVINCAGFGTAGAVEDTSIDEARAQFETNFFGTVRVCQAVLPRLRQQRGGTIINISSMGGLMSIPFQGMYSGSKFAIEGMTESLRMEVAPFGIRVILIEPGDFQTQFSARRVRALASATNSAYQKYFNAALNVMENDESHSPKPVRICRLVSRIIRSRSKRFRYLIGPLQEIIAALLKSLLPYQVFERIIKTYYKLM